MQITDENLSTYNSSHYQYINNRILNLQFNGTENFKLSDSEFTNTILRVVFGKDTSFRYHTILTNFIYSTYI